MHEHFIQPITISMIKRQIIHILINMSVIDHHRPKYHIRATTGRIPRESIPPPRRFQDYEPVYERTMEDLQHVEYEMMRIRCRIRTTRNELQDHDASIRSARNRLNTLLQEIGQLRRQLDESIAGYGQHEQ